MNNSLPQTSQDIFDPFEYTVDEQTGEIIECPDITTEQLPRVARRLIKDRETYEQRIASLDNEIDRLKAIKELYTERFSKSREFLLGLCQALMRTAGKDKLEYPGIGKFRFGMTRESVDDSPFKEMLQEQQAEIIDKYPGLFITKTSVNPNKKEIIALLKNGVSVDGFTLNEKQEKFEFKEE